MLPFLRWLPRLGRAWKPLDFSKSNPLKLPASQLVEEEKLPGYKPFLYYPVRVGEIIQDRYQIVGKLGYGVTSTVWLARDLDHRRHVALKLFINSRFMSSQLDNELNIYHRINAGAKKHPGYGAIRTLIDAFDVGGPDGMHQCLVHPPLFESVKAVLRRNPAGRLPAPIAALVLKRLFLALDFLHSECQIIHTDLKADNIMFSIDDETVFTDFEKQQLQDPCPQKEADGRTIYVSCGLRMPKSMGVPVLCDFGSAVLGDTVHTEDVQPDIYRSPEVILEAPWSYGIDIWNVGAMVWDIFEGGHLFTGQDPEHNTYRSRAHLAEIVSLLGPPPRELLSRGVLSHTFFTNDGTFSAGIDAPASNPLERLESSLDGQSKEQFLLFMHKMLQWDPKQRSTAKELAEDEWIRTNAARQ